MSMRIPRLSRGGTREIVQEMENPPADTPERRETFRRADAMHRFVERLTQPPEPAERH
jgi:hypothetical protein